MASKSVYWGEGLFLRPHHFQCVERSVLEKIRIAENWGDRHCYGLQRLDVDLDSLSNWRVSLASCHLRLPDGTHLRFPEDAHISAVDIPRKLFAAADTRIKVYVGVAEYRNGFSNTDTEGSNPQSRYVLASESVEDENAPGNAEQIQFRRFNPRILIGDDAALGYDALPIMQLRLGATAEAPPEIDPDYIPPLIASEAWPWLSGFIRSVYDRLGATADRLARQMIDRGVAFESGHKEDLERILQLHAVNSALGGVAHLPFIPGVHPYVIYTEMCRIVGQLAVFRRERRFPDIPVYDHDDLSTCFMALRRLLNVEEQKDESYIRRPFAAQGLQMSVRLQTEWLEPSWAFYIGVECKLKTSEVTDLLSERSLGMKVGNTDEVDNIYKFGRRGVRLAPVADAPRAFPRANWHYYRVDRDEAWRSVEETLNLGIRFNERNVAQQINGENKIDVKNRHTGELVSLAFSLFAIQAAGA